MSFSYLPGTWIITVWHTPDNISCQIYIGLFNIAFNSTCKKFIDQNSLLYHPSQAASQHELTPFRVHVCMQTQWFKCLVLVDVYCIQVTLGVYYVLSIVLQCHASSSYLCIQSSTATDNKVNYTGTNYSNGL